MKNAGPITGTFIDDITYDIPSSNWSEEQWLKELDYMQEVGIDTVIFIRGGFAAKAVFPSETVGNKGAYDFADFIFKETSKRMMNVYFGMYISEITWHRGDVEYEIERNKPFLDEVLERYGDYPSFKGWYIPQEADGDIFNFKDILKGMGALCKEKSPDKKVLISPFFRTSATFAEHPHTPEDCYKEWDRLFSYGGENIDICAFQDGTAPLAMMDEYYGKIKELCHKYSMEHWVNVETFERDVRQMYYPIPFYDLRNKIEHHKKYAEKMITFEFSHFLSPQSIYPSAHNLNSMYKKYYNL